MKRMLLAAMASSALVLVAPSMASAAHHGNRHHRGHPANAHRRHAKGARLLTFTAATSHDAVTGAPAGPSTTPTTASDEAAGTVKSFEGGVLTIRLTDGTVVSGKVTEQTELQCPAVSPPATLGEDDQGGGDDHTSSQGSEHGGPASGDQIAGPQHSDSQSGDRGDEGQEGNDDESEASCTTAALVFEAKVGEAELSLSSAGAVWQKVELIS
jgi:hypothetical protein